MSKTEISSWYKGEVNPTTHSIFSQNFIRKKIINNGLSRARKMQ